VHGVLFEIPDEAKEAVLRKEGVATGLSQEVDVAVEVTGQTIAASAFVARPEKRSAPGAPSARLMTYLLEGARERGLPRSWIEELERHQSGAAPASAAPGSGGLKLGLKR
jgi:cation transport regulator ChaC